MHFLSFYHIFLLLNISLTYGSKMEVIKFPIKIQHINGSASPIEHITLFDGEDILLVINKFFLKHDMTDLISKIILMRHLICLFDAKTPLKLYVYGLSMTTKDICAEEIIGGVCRAAGLEGTGCYSLYEDTVKLSWQAYNSLINFENLDYSLQLALDTIEDERIIFGIEIPFDIPYGIGNVLKAFITALSIHNNTKVQNDHYFLGSYDTVLAEHHIYNISRDSQQPYLSCGLNYYLLVLREEEEYFKKNYITIPGRPLINSRLSVLFSPNISIDNIFDRSRLPAPVIDRILMGIGKIEFLPNIIILANSFQRYLTSPSLGISIRSYRGPHEGRVNRTLGYYNATAYKHKISYLIDYYQIKSVLIAFDNPEILALEYIEFLEAFNIVIVTLDANNAVQNHLQKAIVEMLALSKTDILLGDKKSSFMEMVFWFGGCNQIVHDPYKK